MSEQPDRHRDEVSLPLAWKGTVCRRLLRPASQVRGDDDESARTRWFRGYSAVVGNWLKAAREKKGRPGKRCPPGQRGR